MERLEDFARGIVQGDGAAVRAAHGAIGRGQRAQEPLHLGGVQARVDLDGGPAGDGGADAAAEIVQRGAAQFALGGLQDLKQDLLQIRRAPWRPARL